MRFDRRELKARARRAMGETNPRFWVVTLVYILLTTGVQVLLSLAASALTGPVGLGSSLIFFNILFLLYSVVIQFGFQLWSLWTWRRMNPGLGALTQGFSIPGRVILMEVFIFLRVLGWSMVLILVMTLFLMPVAAALSPVVYLLYTGVIYAVMIVIMLRYTLAPYLLADRPDDGASAAIRRSVELMRGWKWELFKLLLSFLGWQLINWVLSTAVFIFLCAQAGLFQMSVGMDTLLIYQSVSNGLPNLILSALVTLPLSLWLTPYLSVSQAGFYDMVRQSAPRPDASEMPPL